MNIIDQGYDEDGNIILQGYGESRIPGCVHATDAAIWTVAVDSEEC